MIVSRSPNIKADVLQQRLALLERLAPAEFRDRNAAGRGPRVLDVVQEGGHPVGGGVEPGGERVGRVADGPAVGVDVCGVEAAGIERVGGVGEAGVDAGVWCHVEGRRIRIVGE